MEIRRPFEATIPEGATPAEGEALIEAETARQEEKLLDELLGSI
ncbi:MAG: hypothetical protein JWM23_559 [Microbacteriaceae bacterium]|nr:hypothetical protein [Microbacteriaceae bacterium]